jgi:hypothetical protein
MAKTSFTKICTCGKVHIHKEWRIFDITLSKLIKAANDNGTTCLIFYVEKCPNCQENELTPEQEKSRLLFAKNRREYETFNDKEFDL